VPVKRNKKICSLPPKAMAMCVSWTAVFRRARTRDKGRITKTIYYAKAGRGETIAKLDLELVPTQASGKNLFCCFLTRRSRRLSGRLSDRKPLVTDDRGRVTLPMPWAGRYGFKSLTSTRNPAAAVRKSLAVPDTYRPYHSYSKPDCAGPTRPNRRTLIAKETLAYL
jgi:hypothetical protein